MPSLDTSRQSMSRPVSRTRQAWALLLCGTTATLLSTVVPRLMVLGGLPATDEGVYAYQAQQIHHSISSGYMLPDSGTLALYPMLLSWVFGLDANPFVLLRLMDLGAAALMALLLFCILRRVSASPWAAALLVTLFMFTMNQPLFIQSGFKNSIAAAFVPLMLALQLGQNSGTEHSLRWWSVGALTAVAVLLRETFVPFAALGLVAIAWTRGSRPALAFVAGGLATSVVVLGAVLAARGSWHGLAAAYGRASGIYAAVSDQRTELLLANGSAAIREAAVGLVFAGALALALVLVLVLMLLARRWRAAHVSPALFWLGAALLPLIEPASKIGFPYHFAVSLPGLAGLSAVAWRHVGALGNHVRTGLYAVGVLSLMSMADKAEVLRQSWPATRSVLAAPDLQWPPEAVQQSNYLLAAEAIKRAMPATGGSLSVSGFMFALYPLTGYLPPRPDLEHLSEVIIRVGYASNALRDALMHCPPDVVMTTTRKEWPGAAEVLAAVEATGLYASSGEVLVSSTRAYGSFGGTVYHRTQPRGCAPR